MLLASSPCHDEPCRWENRASSVSKYLLYILSVRTHNSLPDLYSVACKISPLIPEDRRLHAARRTRSNPEQGVPSNETLLQATRCDACPSYSAILCKEKNLQASLGSNWRWASGFKEPRDQYAKQARNKLTAQQLFKVHLVRTDISSALPNLRGVKKWVPADD